MNIPVAVESVAEFESIYGPDAPLAWDCEQGILVHAYLGPAVRGFFQNGGCRCWVIRVADAKEAEYNHFPIPALARATIDNDGNVTRISHAFARARSEGSWSDSLEVGSTLLRNSIEMLHWEPKPSTGAGATHPGVEVTVRPLSSIEVSNGDLLQLSYRDGDYLLMASVQKIEPIAGEDESPASSAGREKQSSLKLTLGPALWFSTNPPEGLTSPAAEANISVFDATGAASTISIITWSAAQDGSSTFFLGTTLEESPPPGTVVRLDVGASTMWLTVDKRDTAHLNGSPPKEGVQITGQGLWVIDPNQDDLLGESAVCEILTLELWARQPGNPIAKLTGLGFDSNHDMYWGALPTDKDMYSNVPWDVTSNRTALNEAAAIPRFPLAGPGEDPSLCFPVAMPFIPTYYLGARNDARTSLERDGLSVFDSSMFLDTELASTGVADLLPAADFLRYQSPTPRPLCGMHAALAIEEATILAVPDAVHRGWARAAPEDLPNLPVFPPVPRPEWWHFLDCAPPSSIPLTSEPAWENFLDCSIRILAPPVLGVFGLTDTNTSSDKLSTETGSFTLKWSTVLDEGVHYILEESVDPEFSNPSMIYSGSDEQLTMYGRGAGRYFYRLRLEIAGQTSDWSNGVLVQVGPVPQWTLLSEDKFEPDDLLAIHRSSMRLSAARGDMLAVLTLPAHFREEESIKYVSTLKSTSNVITKSQLVSPLGDGESVALSYAALYHPWTIATTQDQSDQLRAVPSEGIICGTIAKRASTIGAWIAPANEIMQGIISLSPAIGSAWYQRFQDEQINLLRQEPRGFLCLNSDTLSDDEDLRPINVRRLLILLRRLALRLGSTYVFEPNDAGFRRRVQRGFESMLNFMYTRGAFKGTDPDSAYQVVTDSSVNPDESIEQGRFVVELRVAPSLPMRFLTIRLVQTGDNSLVAIEE